MVSAGFSIIFSEVIVHLINRNKPSLTNLAVKMEIWQSNCTFFLGGWGVLLTKYCLVHCFKRIPEQRTLVYFQIQNRNNAKIRYIFNIFFSLCKNSLH